MKTPTFASDESALSWANQHFPFSEHRVTRDLPWSKTFELRGTLEMGYLKLIPLRQQQILKTNTVLSQHFKSILPETIAINDELSLQLLRGHRGIELGSDPSELQMQKLLSSYAKMQTESKNIPEIISSIPTLNLENLIADFLNFLKPKEDADSINGQKVHANFFLGNENAQEYYEVFLARKEILEDFLKSASLLPLSLNHCDLSSRKVAERDDGSCIIYDWDDAFIGPAGLSLHVIFNSCFKITQFLNTESTGDQNEFFYTGKRLLHHYINELDKHGFASKEKLQQALPATACAGAIQTLLNYANFAIDDDFYIFGINEYFEKSLYDLLNLCDFLSCSSRDKALYFANEYYERDIKFRTAIIYQQYLKVHPNDFDIHKRQADILNQSGKWEEAITHFNYIIEQNPNDAEAYNELGVTFLKNNNPTDAIQQFEIALSIAPDYREVQINHDKASTLLHMVGQAQHPNNLPTVHISSEERVLEKYNSEKTDTACNLFKKYGALVAENVFDPNMLQLIKELILDKYNSYFESKEYDDCLCEGDAPHIVTLGIEGAINSPNLYDNPFLRDILKKTLGDDYILGALNIGISLPGSKNQSIHKSYTPLFDESDEFRESIPCFAAAILIPLVQDSHAVGTTLVVKESQRIPYVKAHDLPSQTPFLGNGSCLMIDYRVSHQELGNSSDDIVRPLLTLTYHRSWFRDCINYRRQAPIIIDDEIFNTSPERLKELISWAKSEAIINPTNNRRLS